MTKNNYPEGLDELAKVILLKSGIGLYNTAKISGDELSSNFARALLDALAKRGYVLVDAKKQEPEAWATTDGRVVHSSTMNSAKKDRGAMLSSLSNYTTPLYTHPAIPGRVALPEMSERAKAEVIGWLTDAAHEAAGEDFDAGLFADHEVAEALRAIAAMLSATTPPTQPQVDRSLRRDAE